MEKSKDGNINLINTKVNKCMYMTCTIILLLSDSSS